jgi:hypothetical protein
MVCQLSCTGSPAEITVGVALNTAVGAGADTGGGAVSCAIGGCFFLQPGNVVKASSNATGIKTDLRRFNGLLLICFELSSVSNSRPVDQKAVIGHPDFMS